jgi:DNA-binding NarL/FixJ family response regulator
MPRKVHSPPVFLSGRGLNSNHSAGYVAIKPDTDDEVFSADEWSEIIDELDISQRQSQVLWQLLHGRSDKQIARELALSVGTVRTHLDRLYLRFAVQDRSELIVLVFSHFRRKCRLIGCPRFRRHGST